MANMAEADKTRHRIDIPALTIAQWNVVDLLAAGKMDADASETVGVSRQTVNG